MNRNDEDEDGEAGEELTPEELALFLLSDPRGSVGDGDTPGAALADLKRKLG